MNRTIHWTDRWATRAWYPWVIVGLLWLANILSFFDRQAMAFVAPFMSTELGYTSTQIGLISGAVFLGYTLVQIPGGWLGDKFGQRRWILIGIASWSVFSALSGVVAQMFLMLLLVRFAMGVGEGIMPPAGYRVLANWFGHGRRTFALGMLLTSSAIGPALAPLIAAPIIRDAGWRWVFYLTLLPGIVVGALVLLLLRDSRERVDAPQAATRSSQPDQGFQLRNLMSLHLLGQFAGIFFLAFTLYGLNAWLPTYLVKYRHLDLSTLASYSSLPYIAGVLGMVIGALLCNRVLAERRTEFIVAGLLVAGLCIAGVWIAESAVIAEMFLICGLFFTYMIMGPIFSLPLDTVPTSGAGTYMGAVNMAPQIAGFSAPIVIGVLVSGGSFAPAFVAMIGAMVLSAVTHLLVRRAARRRVDAKPAQRQLPEHSGSV